MKMIFEEKEMDWFWLDFYIIFEVDPENLDKIKNYASCFVELYNELFE